MNKLQGFFELQDAGLPCVEWREFSTDTSLDKSVLWTIRSAVARGDDQNLPRLIGASAEKAEAFARGLLRNITGMVIYYPYFVADKSGTLEIGSDFVTIECVEGDLWLLVSEGKRAVTYMLRNEYMHTDGDENFLEPYERKQILSHVSGIRGRMRQHLAQGRSVLLEWSFARLCDIEKNPVGKSELVFYEMRTI